MAGQQPRGALGHRAHRDDQVRRLQRSRRPGRGGRGAADHPRAPRAVLRLHLLRRPAPATGSDQALRGRDRRARLLLRLPAAVRLPLALVAENERRPPVERDPVDLTTRRGPGLQQPDGRRADGADREQPRPALRRPLGPRGGDPDPGRHQQALPRHAGLLGVPRLPAALGLRAGRRPPTPPVTRSRASRSRCASGSHGSFAPHHRTPSSGRSAGRGRQLHQARRHVHRPPRRRHPDPRVLPQGQDGQPVRGGPAGSRPGLRRPHLRQAALGGRRMGRSHACRVSGQRRHQTRQSQDIRDLVVEPRDAEPRAARRRRRQDAPEPLHARRVRLGDAGLVAATHPDGQVDDGPPRIPRRSGRQPHPRGTGPQRRTKARSAPPRSRRRVRAGPTPQ